MEKIVGSMRTILCALFVLLGTSTIFGSSEIVVSMQDMNHKPITQAMCQAPFILQVELRNLEEYTDIHLMQYIIGIENFKASRPTVSRNVLIENGKKTVKSVYTFILRADQKGTFTIGPVALNDAAGNYVKSNRLIIPVGDELILSDKDKREKYFITMDVNKKHAYVGEKVTLTIKFYDRIFVDDLHLQFPDLEAMYMVKNKNHVRKHLVDLDGQEYSVTEWTFDMYGKQPEAFILQDVCAAFFDSDTGNRFTFGGAFDLFRAFHKTQQKIVAPPVKIDIVPLPYHKNFSDVVPVGQFSKFTITAQQDSAAAGQGIVVTTELFGSGNFEMMQPPVLELPDGFKYYDSKMPSIDESRTFKHCEFIVQAHTPGTYHIQAQSFVYFDPIDEKYKTLQSNSLDITITPGTQQSQVTASSYDDDQSTDFDAATSAAQTLQDFTIIEQQTYLHAQPSAAIPLPWFAWLLRILFASWILCYVYRKFLKTHIFEHSAVRRFLIFYRAKKLCERALRLQQADQLYGIFMWLFEQLLDLPQGHVHEVQIMQYFKEKKYSEEQIIAWQAFYQQLLQTSFAVQTSKIDQQKLFDEAFVWLQILKDKA